MNTMIVDEWAAVPNAWWNGAQVFPHIMVVHEGPRGKLVRLISDEARQCVFESTGLRYNVIFLTADDPLLSLLLLRYNR